MGKVFACLYVVPGARALRCRTVVKVSLLDVAADSALDSVMSMKGKYSINFF